MLVIPAIDLRGGKVVRLRQGDAAAQTVYSKDPLAVAHQFKAQGATRLHVVDLDGAFSGQMAHLELIGELTKAGMDVEVGGGIRSLKTLEQLFSQGVRWGILGTQVARDPEFVREAAGNFPEQIIVGLDLKEGQLAIGGWQETVEVSIEELLGQLQEWKVDQIVYTEVSRDGMLEGPHFQGLERLGKISPLPLVASGGVSSLGDIKRLAAMAQGGLPIVGAIVGKAIYNGNLDLARAIASCKECGGYDS
jgi:phosphoribosylformimino-5-aminoimidazole carboxamide ribotide isomerase